MTSIRRATEEDIERCDLILNHAKDFLRSQGLSQWQWGYPSRQNIEHDVEAKELYVAYDEETGEILGSAMITLAGEPNYNSPLRGTWLTDSPNDAQATYACIHRVTCAPEHRGKGVMITLAGEPNYNSPLRGTWLTDSPNDAQATYACIHRVTCAPEHRGKGVATSLMAECERQAREAGKRSCRVETHPHNASMRHIAEKMGYVHCCDIASRHDQAECERQAREAGKRSCRVETHPHNASMRHIAEKMGYVHCCDIASRHDQLHGRVAYEKLLDPTDIADHDASAFRDDVKELQECAAVWWERHKADDAC